MSLTILLYYQAVQNIVGISKDAETEAGTLKYAICIPREDDGKTFYALEECDPQPLCTEEVLITTDTRTRRLLMST